MSQSKSVVFVLVLNLCCLSFAFAGDPKRKAFEDARIKRVNQQALELKKANSLTDEEIAETQKLKKEAKKEPLEDSEEPAAEEGSVITKTLKNTPAPAPEPSEAPPSVPAQSGGALQELVFPGSGK